MKENILFFLEGCKELGKAALRRDKISFYLIDCVRVSFSHNSFVERRCAAQNLPFGGTLVGRGHRSSGGVPRRSRIVHSTGTTKYSNTTTF